MRLICPNCEAEYEVDVSVIPPTGRDVQCSNCSHTWFQAALSEDTPETAPNFASSEVATPLADDPVEEPVEDALAPATPEPEPDDDEAGEEVRRAPARVTPRPPPRRAIDPGVLSVLREEAEREAEARRAEGNAPEAIATENRPIPTPPPHSVDWKDVEVPLQPEIGAEPEAEAGPRPNPKWNFIDDDEEEAPVQAPPPSAAPSQAKQANENLFPIVEVLSSTLRNSAESREDETASDDDVLPKAPRSGFGRGFRIALGLAALIVILYAMAPRLASQVPALSPVLKGYVAGVDALRFSLDALMSGMVATLHGLVG